MGITKKFSESEVKGQGHSEVKYFALTRSYILSGGISVKVATNQAR